LQWPRILSGPGLDMELGGIQQKANSSRDSASNRRRQTLATGSDPVAAGRRAVDSVAFRPMLRRREEQQAGMETVADYKVNPNVVAQRVEDQIVVVNLETNRIFALNSTAARVWELLSEGRDDSAIHAELRQEYAVDAGELSSEIERLLQEMNAESLIQASDDG
jgi:coenzyme PQQ synthesis protein D (PqqD)